MIVLRLDFKNGLHLEYNFPEISTAQVIYERLSGSMLNKELVSIDDYAGRSAWIDAGQLVALGMIDLETEAKSVVALNLLVEAAGLSAVPADRRPVLGQQTRQPAEAPLPRHDA